jgi:hypothetical protein
MCPFFLNPISFFFCKSEPHINAVRMCSLQIVAQTNFHVTHTGEIILFLVRIGSKKLYTIVVRICCLVPYECNHSMEGDLNIRGLFAWFTCRLIG